MRAGRHSGPHHAPGRPSRLVDFADTAYHGKWWSEEVVWGKTLRTPLDNGEFSAVAVSTIEFWENHFGEEGMHEVDDVFRRLFRASIGQNYDFGWAEAELYDYDAEYLPVYTSDLVNQLRHSATVIGSKWIRVVETTTAVEEDVLF